MNKTLPIPSKYREYLEELRMLDDDFLRIIMQNEECAKVILNAILDEDISIVRMDNQMDIHYPSKRSIVYDIHVITDKEYMDIEVEKHKHRAHPKRVRYHTSLLDVNSSKPGMNFSDMYDIKVIFICEFDPLGKGSAIYHIKDTVIETGEIYDDQREIILVNTNAIEDSKLGEIIHDLKQTKSDNMYNPVLKKAMKYFKETDGGVIQMSEIWEKIKNDGKNEGKAEGKIETNIRAIKNIMANLNYDIIDAMKLLEIPEEEYEKYSELVLK